MTDALCGQDRVLDMIYYKLDSVQNILYGNVLWADRIGDRHSDFRSTDPFQPIDPTLQLFTE